MSKKHPNEIEGGAPCPKCHRPMQRYQHPANWQPKPRQPYYFTYWDRCRPCRHWQMYEAAKVYTSDAIERALDQRQLDMLDETGRADLPWT